MKLYPINDIKIGDRRRKDLGDVQALAESIKRVGLLHPIVVSPDGWLIAGERRIEAFKLLGREHIPATVAQDLTEVIAQQQAEIDENTCRKDFTPSEAVAKGREYEPFERHAARVRQQTLNNGWRDDAPENFTGATGNALDRVAAAVGMSRPTYCKAKEVVEAAEEEPELFAPIVEEMDRTGNVTRAYRKYQAMRDEQAIQRGEFREPDGKYHTIVIDPPWEYDLNLLGRSRPEYAVMDIDSLEDMNLGEWAADDCHLYVWVTNAMIPKACRLIEAWGFEYKTMITWVKPSIGLGSYFRNSTEHVMFARRGSKSTRAKDIPTHFEAARLDHSAKPDEFYAIVERASYPPYLDVFARRARDGWDVWGNVNGNG